MVAIYYNQSAGGRIMSDEELMTMFSVTGNSEAFNEIVRRFQKPIVIYFQRSGRQHADAEELTQDVFVQIIRCREQYESGKSVNSWIFSIATHLMIDRHRSETRARAANSPDMLTNDFLEFDIADTRVSSPPVETLRPYIERLPEQQRALIEAIFFDCLTWSEAGDKLGMDQGKVYRQFKAAIEQLRHWLTQTGVAAA